MLTFGAEHPFHARLDLPTCASERRECRRALLVRPVLRHGVGGAVRALHRRRCPGRVVRAGPGARVQRAGIEVVDVLRSDGRTWFAVPLEPSAVEGPGTPYDVSSHLFTPEAVASGPGDPVVAGRAGSDRRVRPPRRPGACSRGRVQVAGLPARRARAVRVGAVDVRGTRRASRPVQTRPTASAPAARPAVSQRVRDAVLAVVDRRRWRAACPGVVGTGPRGTR